MLGGQGGKVQAGVESGDTHLPGVIFVFMVQFLPQHNSLHLPKCKCYMHLQDFLGNFRFINLQHKKGQKDPDLLDK